MDYPEYKQLISSQPVEYSGPLDPVAASSSRTIVVLDDDPTGCQTVRNVPVLTHWDRLLLEEKFRAEIPVFFILTNTRSMIAADAVLLTREVTENLKKASHATGRDFLVISRSDSTLRGHFPEETDTIASALDMENALRCLIPAFFQGGRYTLHNIHYVLENERLIPAAETPFADDRVFGFRSSDLPGYVEEKTHGRISKARVLSISLDELRKGGPEHVKERLTGTDKPVCIVNAISQRDLDVFAHGAWIAIGEGKQIIFRTAASFINSVAGIPLSPLLGKDDIITGKNRGALFIVGSYVPKSSQQLIHLLEQDGITSFELNVEELLKGKGREYISSLAGRLDSLIAAGKNPVFYTSRKLITGSESGENLQIGQRISAALAAVVRQMNTRPGYILCKGGITSHVVACDGLGIREATVSGQILPGVPVWKVRKGKKFTDMPLIIFPGNVGTETSLTEIYQKLG